MKKKRTEENLGPNREWQKDYSVERDHKSYYDQPEYTPRPLNGMALQLKRALDGTLISEGSKAYYVRAVNLIPALRKHLQGKCDHETTEECNAAMLLMVYSAEGK